MVKSSDFVFSKETCKSGRFLLNDPRAGRPKQPDVVFVLGRFMERKGFVFLWFLNGLGEVYGRVFCVFLGGLECVGAGL